MILEAGRWKFETGFGKVKTETVEIQEPHAQHRRMGHPMIADAILKAWIETWHQLEIMRGAVVAPGEVFND
ncbi:MAG: hypothetical protein WB995_17180 [Candidatus Acidiferrales bacterium]